MNKRKNTEYDIQESILGMRLSDRILFDRRTICMFSMICSETAEMLIKDLLALDKVKKAPIYLHINSPGGELSQGLAIIDTMRGLRSPITTIITGEACSMATFVALYGKHRLMTSNSFWMGHEMQHDVSDYYTKTKYRFEYQEGLWIKLRDVYRNRTKLTPEDINVIEKGELWLDANQCLKKGIVDKVLG